MIPIRSNTSKGWSPASEGDGIYMDGRPTARHITRDGASVTVTATRGGVGVIESEDPVRIRRLSALEAWRLMGFTDEEYAKAKGTGAGETALFRMAGNSIVVPVLVSVFEGLLDGSTDGQRTLDGW